MQDLLLQLESKAFELKDPWRSTDKSLAVVVPIVAKTPGTRDYVVIDEVKEDVELIDTGSIDRTEVKNKSDKTVFMRGGTILKGGTQNRTIQYGVIVTPSKESMTIPVLCIHASNPIRTGASFDAKGFLPRAVQTKHLLSGGQSEMWGAIQNHYSDRARDFDSVSDGGGAAVALALTRVASDDLVHAEETIHQFDEQLKSILKNIPDMINQVGVVVLDPNGLLGLELYNHPDSWEAYSESIIKSFSDALTKTGKIELFIPNVEVAIDVIQTFLDLFKNYTSEDEVYNQDNARTVILKTTDQIEGHDYVGEYTQLNGNTIHLSITRSD